MLAIDIFIILQQATEAVGEHAGDITTAAEHISIFEQISGWCTEVIRTTNYPGIFFLMALESMIAPIPSEAVMPFAGFLISTGEMTWILVALWSTLGSFVGSIISYWMGMYGGRPLVLKIGKYLLLNVHHLDATERYFKRYGPWTVFICRFIPVVRHFISIPAGMGRMPISSFLVMTVIGAVMWNMFLAWAGFYLKENWDSLKQYFHIIDRVIVVIILAVIIAFVVRQVIEWRAQKKASQGADNTN
jgi:membrane protein DedA with SNARE-associated domain